MSWMDIFVGTVFLLIFAIYNYYFFFIILFLSFVSIYRKRNSLYTCRISTGIQCHVSIPKIHNSLVCDMAELLPVINAKTFEQIQVTWKRSPIVFSGSVTWYLDIGKVGVTG